MRIGSEDNFGTLLVGKKNSNELSIGKLNLFVKEFQVNITKIM